MEIRSAKFPIPPAVLIAAIYLLLNTGCARIADPQPPKVRIPKSAADLTVYQLANSIVLSVTMPDQNTDGSPITTLQRVDIFRIEEESISDTIEMSLSEKQFLTQASRIRSIPKAQFPDYLHDKTFILRDEPQIPPGASFYTLALRYAVAFVNNKGQAAGLSNQVTIQPVPIPPPPEEISGNITESAIQLKWTPPDVDGSKPAAIEGYNIYRSEQPDVFPSTPINPLPLKQTEFEDHRFQFSKTYYYAVTTIGSLRKPFAESLHSKVFPLKTRDIFPPVPPEDFNALFEKSMVILLWGPSSSSDVAGYRISRQEQGATTRQPLQQELITSLSFRDNKVEMGKLYEYSIQAIDSSGNESSAIRVEVKTQ